MLGYHTEFTANVEFLDINLAAVEALFKKFLAHGNIKSLKIKRLQCPCCKACYVRDSSGSNLRV